MEFSEKETNVYIEFLDGNGEVLKQIDQSTEEIILESQVSGSIQEYNIVEIGFYTDPALMLCGYGNYVCIHVPLEKFIMASGWVKFGIKAPGRTSMFSHMAYWQDGNTDPNVYLDFDELYKDLSNKNYEGRTIDLKMMIIGIAEHQSDVIMRDKVVLSIKNEVPETHQPPHEPIDYSDQDLPDRTPNEPEETPKATFDEIFDYMFTTRSVVRMNNTPGMLVYYRLKIPATIVKFSSFDGDDFYSAETYTKDEFETFYNNGDFNLNSNADFLAIDDLPSHLKWKEE